MTAESNTEQKSNITKEQLLLPDEPITSLDQDRLERKYFAKHLAHVLISYDSPSSLVVALYGPWGVGKSSLLNLIDEYLKTIPEEDQIPVIVHFNPWSFSSIDQLITMFFGELRRTLGQKDKGAIAGKIGVALETVGHILSPGSLSPVGGQCFDKGSGFLKGLGRWMKGRSSEQKPLDAVKKDLNQSMDEYGRRVIVFIDDIDRLERENMRLIFRLIRLNGDFNNTTYVLALDRGNTERTLRDIQGDSGRRYLEKIVQVGFDIPPADQVVLGEMFFQQLDKVISPIPQDEWEQERWQELYLDALRHFIRTPRDIVRYVNGLYITMPPLTGEVNPVDFIGLEALRTFAPDIFGFIRESQEIFAPESSTSLHSENKEGVKQLLEEQFSRSDPGIEKAVRQTCRHLFPQLASIYENMSYAMSFYADWRKRKRICSREFFDRYFYLSISKREVPEAELRAIVSVASDKEAFSGQLQMLIENGKFKRFLERFEDYLPELSEEAAPLVLGSLFDVGDRLPVHPERFFDIDPQLHIARIAYLLLARNPSKERRAVIAKELANSCSGLTTLIRWVALIEPEEGKNTEVSPLGEDLLELSDFIELREIVLNRIRSEAKKGTLSKRPLLGAILFRWRDWAHVSEPNGYVSELVKTDEGLLDFLVGSVTVMLSTGEGKYGIRRTPTISREHISEFVDPESLTNRVERIKNSKWGELSQEQREAVDAFFRRDGRIF